MRVVEAILIIDERTLSPFKGICVKRNIELQCIIHMEALQGLDVSVTFVLTMFVSMQLHCIAHFLPHPVLYFLDVIYNTRKQRATSV